MKILSAVKKAAAEMRGECVTYTAPLITDEPPVQITSAAGGSISKLFEFVAPLGTIEVFDELSLELKQKPGILGVSGSERTITPIWDPSRLTEAAVRQILTESGHAVKP